MKKYYFILFSLICSAFGQLTAQDFYRMDSIQKIEITFIQPNWDYILDTAKQGSDSYTLASQVKINGSSFDSVGVKYKGNSSYNPVNVKNPFHIELDHFKNHSYYGIKDIKLSNGYNEPSFLREVMLYSIFQKYADAPRANFAQVFVNNQYIGLYTNVEAVTKTYLFDRHFTNDNPFVFADNGGCDLRYKGADTTLYYTPYTLKSEIGWRQLRDLCDSLQNLSDIESILDIDRTLWYLAYTNAFVILDSYLGNAKHNYYVYQDHHGRFMPIIWDLNGGLGIFNRPASGINYTVAQMQNMSPMLHATDSMWPLVKNILSIPMYKRMYFAHMKTILQENISDSSYYALGLNLQSIIDTAVFSDIHKFGTYAQFQTNLINNVVIGPKTVPGITFLMEAREDYLANTPEFLAPQPSITSIQTSTSYPIIFSSIFITAIVSNANTVFLGVRNSVLGLFNKMPMFDDGAHGDGVAGDGIYGVSVPVTSSQMQYYIYAENNNAGKFSPARAEHEFHTLTANSSILAKGDLVINELLAINTMNTMNANGDFNDWIELYNTTNNPISLDSVYVSDNSSNVLKWEFPKGIVVAPHAYTIVWADEDHASNEWHASFKLAGNGDTIFLAYANGLLLDSVVYPSQISDISYGRYPNGTGNFTGMPPTFQGSNIILSSANTTQHSDKIMVYPNPCKDYFIVQHHLENLDLRIFDMVGRKVFEQHTISANATIRTTFPNGLYLFVFDADHVHQTILFQKNED